MTGLPSELVSAILADVGDDGPRLAAADWLEEQGRADDARFVRVQLRTSRERELRVSTRELSRLNAEAEALRDRHLKRWINAALGVPAEDPCSGMWTRGFLTHATFALRAARPGVLAALAAFPLLERLDFVGDTLIPVDELLTLPALARLHTLTLEVDAERLTAGHIEAIARVPRLSPSVRGLVGGRVTSLMRGEEWAALNAARDRHLRSLPAREALASLEMLASTRIKLDRTRGGRSRVRMSSVPSDKEAAVLARATELAALDMPCSDVPAWLAHLPDLRSLTLRGLARFDPAPLAGLRELRAVGIGGAALTPADWDAILAWLGTLPKLGAVVDVGPPSSQDGGRVARFAAGLPASRATRRAVPVPVALDGVTLNVPDTFARVEPPPAADGVEPLAAWAAWGDGDPLDRIADGGPTWAVLERLPFKARVADAAALLMRPPGELGRVHEWSAVIVKRDGGASDHRLVLGSDPFCEHLRALWIGKRFALRLRIESAREHSNERGVNAGIMVDSLASVGA